MLVLGCENINFHFRFVIGYYDMLEVKIIVATLKNAFFKFINFMSENLNIHL